jgi:hypothetical protein
MMKKLLLATVALSMLAMPALAAQSSEKFKEVIPAGELIIGDMIAALLPPVRACVRLGDPKLAEMNRKHREETIKARREFPDWPDYQLPPCIMLDAKTADINLVVVSSISPAVSPPARVIVCFSAVSLVGLGLGGDDTDNMPLYCADLWSAANVKIWKRKE